MHGNSLEAHDFLGNTQVDIVAHGLWNWGNYRLDSTNSIPHEIKKVLDTEIENKVGYMPTLQVINGLNALTNSEYLDNPELENVLPKQLIEYYKINVDIMYNNVFGDAPKHIITKNFNRLSNQGKINLKYLNDHEGKILFGTDTPSSPTYGNPPGYNGYLEMLEMEKAGIPLSKILAMATIENPLKDITAYNDISQIIIYGKPIYRSMLSAKEIEDFSEKLK